MWKLYLQRFPYRHRRLVFSTELTDRLSRRRPSSWVETSCRYLVSVQRLDAENLHEIAYPANEDPSACAVVWFWRISVLRQESPMQRRHMNVPFQRPVDVLGQCVTKMGVANVGVDGSPRCFARFLSVKCENVLTPIVSVHRLWMKTIWACGGVLLFRWVHVLQAVVR